MSVDQISLLLAFLSFLAAGIGVASLGATTFKPEALRPLMSVLLPLAFAVALASTIGSLYYSGVVHFRPCRLCWWQRIFMYPLVPILGIASAQRGRVGGDRMGSLCAAVLAVGGLGYSAYHTQLRWFPDQGSSCEAEAACTSVWVNTFGFVSIPFMAFCGFLAVLGLTAGHLRLTRPASAAPSVSNSLVPASSTERQSP